MEEKRMVRVGSKGHFMKASALLAAEMIGGAAVVGTSQSAAAYGLSAALLNLGLALSLFVGVFACISIYHVSSFIGLEKEEVRFTDRSTARTHISEGTVRRSRRRDAWIKKSVNGLGPWRPSTGRPL